MAEFIVGSLQIFALVYIVMSIACGDLSRPSRHRK